MYRKPKNTNNMSDDENSRDILQRSAILKILSMNPSCLAKESVVRLFSHLLDNSESLPMVFSEISNIKSISVMIKVLELIYNHYKEKPRRNETNNGINWVQLISGWVNIFLPSNTSKNDAQSFCLLWNSARIWALFSSIVIPQIGTLISNQISLSIVYLMFYEKNDDEIQLLFNTISPKLGISLLSYSLIFLMSKYSEIPNSPGVKAIIAFAKSISEPELLSLLLKPLLSSLILRVNQSNIKEFPTLITFLSKKLKKDPENAVHFSSFVESLLSTSDSIVVLKPQCDEVLSLLLSLIRSADISDEDPVEDPNCFLRKDIGNAFIRIFRKFGVSPFDTFFPSKIESQTADVLLTVIFLIQNLSIEMISMSSYSIFLAQLPSPNTKLTLNMKFIIHISYFYAIHYNVKLAYALLVKGLELGSVSAAKYLLDEELDFGSVFDAIGKEFRPEVTSTLYIDTLTSLLKNNIETPPISQTTLSSAISESDSNFDLLSSLNGCQREGSNETEFSTSPSSQTILFCGLISTIESNQELFKLLPLSAAAISTSFSQALMERFPTPKQHRFHLDSLAAFGNACQFLDQPMLYALAQTFLMLAPKRALLFLSITLQRLPRNIVKNCIKKTQHYAVENPDICGRMIALVSYSYPDISMTFIDTMILESTSKRRVFFVFKSSEVDEQTLIFVFKAIGSSSVFIDINVFMNDFLPFATNILNKHLNQQNKSSLLIESSLFAIRKLCTRVGQYQLNRPDHVFPFKDFLVQYVCSHYLDIGDLILSSNDNASLISQIPPILQTVSCLLPIKPIRISEKHDRSVELTAVLLQVISVDAFPTIFKASKQFFVSLIENCPTIQTFFSICNPLFPAFLLHPEWKQFASMLNTICSKWERFNLTEGTQQLTDCITQISGLLSHVIPLLVSDHGTVAAEIVSSLISLNCAIRNQILSLPRSIRPSLGDISSLNGEALCDYVCIFLSKPYLTLQVFDLIVSLLDHLKEDKVLSIHQVGIAQGIRFLLNDRGSEEFRYDSKIVSALCSSISTCSSETIPIITIIFGILFRFRLFSILSVLVNNGNNLSDNALSILVKVVLDTPEGSSQLLSEISRYLRSDDTESSALSFSRRVVPMLGDTLKIVDDNTWCLVFSSVIASSSFNRSSLSVFLPGNEFESYLSISQKIKEIRPDCFIVLANNMKDMTNIQPNLLLSLASVSDVACPLFLGLFFSKDPSTDQVTFDILKILLMNRDPQAFAEFSKQISKIIIINLTKISSVIECSNAYISTQTEDFRRSHLSRIIELAIENLQAYEPIIISLLKQTNIPIEILAPLITRVIASQNHNKEMISNIALSLKIPETEEQLPVAILKSELFKPYYFDSIDYLIGQLNQGSIHCAKIILYSSNKENQKAIQALISHISVFLEADDLTDLDVLLNLLM